MSFNLVEQVIVDYGTRAVLRYRDIAGLEHDNRIPEIFLGSFIAAGLFDEQRVNAHVERYYVVIASEHGVTLSPDIIGSIGGYRADIAIYERRTPKGIVELKIFDDGKRPASIVADRDKMAKLSALCGVDAYIGVLVTDTAQASCIDRIHQLGEALGQKFGVVGECQSSKSGLWKWCFAAARIRSEFSS